MREKIERTRDLIRKMKYAKILISTKSTVRKNGVSVASLSLKFTLVYIALLILFHLQENSQKGSTKWMISIGIS